MDTNLLSSLGSTQSSTGASSTDRGANTDKEALDFEKA